MGTIDTNFVNHYSSEMKNVTISLEEDVAAWTRIAAAKSATSVSRWVGEILRKIMLEERSYRAAEKQFFSVEARSLSKEGVRYPRREELYDRPRLR